MNSYSQPLVTIIMPAYNAEKTISKAINSVLGQDYSNIELIVVNDGSTDNTQKICNGFSDTRLIIINQDNLGESEARNTGLSKAKGEFLTFVDSDDWVDCNYISLLLEAIKKNNVELAICGIIREYISYKQHVTFKQSSTYLNCLDNDYFLSFFEGGFINSTCNKLYRRDLIINNKLSFSGKALTEDIGFNIDYLQLIKSANTITECPYHYMINNESLTSKVSEDMIQNYIEIQEQLLDVLPEKSKQIANRFVYHQYIGIFLKYLKKVANKSLKGKDVYPILNKYLKYQLIQDSFNSYSPTNRKNLFIHYLIKSRFYYPIILYFRVNTYNKASKYKC